MRAHTTYQSTSNHYTNFNTKVQSHQDKTWMRVVAEVCTETARQGSILLEL